MSRKRSKPFKKIVRQSTIGQKGVNFVERVVLDMKYAWRPTPIFDVGIDGEIEICDPVTGEATNTFIKVQIKSTIQPFTSETPDSFEYLCEQRDLDYWLRGNAPVILVVCNPDKNEAYWIPIKDYFKELTALKARKVYFDKRLNRFDVSSALELKQLALSKDSGIYFAPLPKTEKLYSNLLKVASFAPRIYVADTDYRRPDELWKKFKEMDVRVGPEWMLTDRHILSLHNLEDSPFNTICDLGTLESFDANEWADAEDENKKREFVRLLNLCLRQRVHLLRMRYYREGKREYFYIPATENLKTRKIWYQSIQRRVSREVFKQYSKKSDPNQRAYCRHSAFSGYFLRLENEWYLEITPTYHFTSDGYNEATFRAELVKGIKQLERNPAVIGHLLMWADYLKKPIGNMFEAEYPFLSFGELTTLEISIGLPDDIWYVGEESGGAEAMSDYNNQPALLGL